MAERKEVSLRLHTHPIPPTAQCYNLHPGPARPPVTVQPSSRPHPHLTLAPSVKGVDDSNYSKHSMYVGFK